VIAFQVNDSGVFSIVCRCKWKSGWDFDSFNVFAVEQGTGDETLLKTIRKKVGGEQEVHLDANRLRMGAAYALCARTDERTGDSSRIPDSELSGDISFEVPYRTKVVYYVEKLKKNWSRIHILLDNDLPFDCLRVFRDDVSFSLPKAPRAGEIYRVRFRASPGDRVSLRCMAKIIRGVRSVESLSELKQHLE